MEGWRVGLASVLVGAVSAMGLAESAAAAPGDLDPAFSADGRVLLKRALPQDIDANGRGALLAALDDPTGGRRPLLYRIRNDGSSDRWDVDAAIRPWEGLRSLRADLLADGGAVAVAVDSDFDYRLLKLSRTGVADHGFGRIEHAPRPPMEILVDEPRGHIYLLAGPELRRYGLQDGLPDLSFGEGGSVDLAAGATPIGGSDWVDSKDLALGSDGAPIALIQVGSGYDGPPDYELVRLKRDGTPDDSFGTGGWSAGILRSNSAFGAMAVPTALGVAPGERVVVSGWVGELGAISSTAPVMALHDGAGEQVGAPAFLGWGADHRDLAIDLDGQAIVAGGLQCSEPQCADLLVGRLSQAGTPDPGFGHVSREHPMGGFTQLDLRSRRPDTATEVEVDARGRPVVAGVSGGRLFVIRLLVRPGPADRDADGVPDGQDRCIAANGPARRGGCPRFGRELRIRRDRSSGAARHWRGRMSSRHPYCLGDALVVKRRLRRKPDRVVARVAALDYTLDGRSRVFSAETSRPFRRAKRRLFYAEVARSRMEDGICRRGVSRARR